MFQHVKQYRQKHGLTQEALGNLLGMAPKFIWNLEKHKPRMVHQGIKVVYTPQEESLLKALFGDTPKTPDYYQGLPTITSKDLHSIRKQRGLTQAQAGDVIGISGAQWGAVEAGKSKEDSPHLRRWYTLLIIHHFPEYFQEMTPADESPTVETQVLTPDPEGPVYVRAADWIATGNTAPNVTSEQATLPTTGNTMVTTDSHGFMSFSALGVRTRVKIVDGQPWWVLSDVCQAVGYAHNENAVRLINSRYLQKLQVSDSAGRQRDVWFVCESGLYQFLTRAQTPHVLTFQDWLFDVVLPQINQTGSYSAQPQQSTDPIDALILGLQKIKQLETMQAESQRRQFELEKQIKQIAVASPADADKVANNAVQKIQALNTKRRELQKLVHSVVAKAKDSKKALAHSYKNHQQVWHFVFDQSNPPVNKLADYTTLAQINTGIDAARNLLSELGGKASSEQLKINMEESELA